MKAFSAKRRPLWSFAGDANEGRYGIIADICIE
jgi:hypothetical protein